MPAWVKDHDLWEKAKAAAQQSYPDKAEEDLWPIVTEIYKKMGGTITAAKAIVFGKAHVKDYDRHDPRTGKPVHVPAHEDRRIKRPTDDVSSMSAAAGGIRGIFAERDKERNEREQYFRDEAMTARPAKGEEGDETTPLDQTTGFHHNITPTGKNRKQNRALGILLGHDRPSKPKPETSPKPAESSSPDLGDLVSFVRGKYMSYMHTKDEKQLWEAADGVKAELVAMVQRGTLDKPKYEEFRTRFRDILMKFSPDKGQVVADTLPEYEAATSSPGPQVEAGWDPQGKSKLKEQERQYAGEIRDVYQRNMETFKEPAQPKSEPAEDAKTIERKFAGEMQEFQRQYQEARSKKAKLAVLQEGMENLSEFIEDMKVRKVLDGERIDFYQQWLEGVQQEYDMINGGSSTATEQQPAQIEGPKPAPARPKAEKRPKYKQGEQANLFKSVVGWILAKAHIKTYQRTDPRTGRTTTVQEHDDKRQSARAQMKHPRQRAAWSQRDERKPKQEDQDLSAHTPAQPQFRPTPPPQRPEELDAWLTAINEEPDIQAAYRAALEGTPTNTIYWQADGSYSPERARLHESIVASLLNPRAVAEANQPRHAVILIGAPASGKTTTFQPAAQELGVEFTVINADDVKEKLPEYTGGNAAMVHEESSHIAEGLLFSQAMQAGHHICLDIVGKNTNKVRNLIGGLYQQGYEISLMYAHLPIEKACARAVDRFRRKGRFVPPTYIAKDVDGLPEQTYTELRDDPRVTHWRRYDNDTEQTSQTSRPAPREAGRRERPGSDLFGKAHGRGLLLQSARYPGLPEIRRNGRRTHGSHARHPGESRPDPSPILARAHSVRADLVKAVSLLDINLQSPEIEPAIRGELLASRLDHLTKIERLDRALQEVQG